MQSALVQDSNSRTLGLDLLRALIVNIVLISHWFHQYGADHNFRTLAGSFAIEGFFVLSGFLIGNILIRGMISKPEMSTVKRFVVRRWLRTLPNYYLFWCLNLLLVWYVSGNFRPRFEYLVFMQNFAWPMPGFYIQTWTMAIEEWFYISLPLALLLVLRSKSTSSSRNILWLVLGVCVAAIAFRLYGSLVEGLDFRKLRKYTIYHFDAPVIGVLGSYLKYAAP
ncbi:MAG TPA: acyltransferase family protein, partial [Bdellovibrionales bacterium]|nr:acyltransferase family protein [Bdellovibrionales bacterium]